MDSKAAFPLALNSLCWWKRGVLNYGFGRENGLWGIFEGLFFRVAGDFGPPAAPRRAFPLRLFISAQHRLYIHAGKKRSAARAQTLVVQLPGNHREGHLLLSFASSAETFNFANNFGRGLSVGFAALAFTVPGSFPFPSRAKFKNDHVLFILGDGTEHMTDKLPGGIAGKKVWTLESADKIETMGHKVSDDALLNHQIAR